MAVQFITQTLSGGYGGCINYISLIEIPLLKIIEQESYYLRTCDLAMKAVL